MELFEKNILNEAIEHYIQALETTNTNEEYERNVIKDKIDKLKAIKYKYLKEIINN